MSVDCQIRRLDSDDAAAFMSLRRAALENEPLAFGSSPADDRFRSCEFSERTLADQDEQAVFGGFDGNNLVGVVGVTRSSGTKERHKASIWGMYVVPHARKRGAGRALLQAAIRHARTWSGFSHLHLSVTELAVAAKSLYEGAGFRCWGTEPRALVWKGRIVDESHLVLEFHSGPARPNETS